MTPEDAAAQSSLKVEVVGRPDLTVTYEPLPMDAYLLMRRLFRPSWAFHHDPIREAVTLFKPADGLMGALDAAKRLADGALEQTAGEVTRYHRRQMEAGERRHRQRPGNAPGGSWNPNNR